MGRITVDVDDDLEHEFRAQAASEFGYKKGALKKGIEAAMETWTASEKEE